MDVTREQSYCVMNILDNHKNKRGYIMNRIKSRTVVIIVLVLLIVCFGAITITTENFFFSTKYYTKAIDAYNETAQYDIALGSTKAKIQLGIITLDKKTCLFVGGIDNNHFVVNEMDVKDGKFSSKGMSYFYDLRENDDGSNKNTTTVSNGMLDWSVLYTESKLSNIDNNTTYSFDVSQSTIYIVVFN